MEKKEKSVGLPLALGGQNVHSSFNPSVGGVIIVLLLSFTLAREEVFKNVMKEEEEKRKHFFFRLDNNKPVFV